MNIKNKTIIFIIIITLLAGSTLPWVTGNIVQLYEQAEGSQEVMTAQDYYNLACLYYEDGMYVEALEAIAQANTLGKSEENYLLQLSIYNDMGSMSEVAETFTKLIEFNPDELNYYTGRGAAYTELGEFELAISDFVYVMEVDENNIEVCTTLVQLYQDIDELDMALKYAELLYNIEETADNLLMIIQLATNVAAYDKVITYGELDIDASISDEVGKLVGNAYFMKAEYEQAFLVLESVANKDDQVYMLLGYAAYNQLLFEEALEYLNEIEEMTDDVQDMIELCQEQIDNTQSQVEVEISEAEVETSETTENIDYKALSYEAYNNKDYDKAIDYIIEYMETTSEVGLDYYLANCYSFNGNDNKAIEHYGISIEKNEEVGESYYNRGLIYLENEEYEEAIVDLGQAYDLGENQDYAIYNQGIAYMNISNFQASTQCFLTVVEISDDEELIAKAEDILSRYYVT